MLAVHPFHNFDSLRISAIDIDRIREIATNMPHNAICSAEMMCWTFVREITVNMNLDSKKEKRDERRLNQSFRLPIAINPTIAPMPASTNDGSSGMGVVDTTTPGFSQLNSPLYQ